MTRRHAPVRRWPLLLAGVLSIAACLDRGVTDTAVVDRIDLTPPVASVESGRSLSLAAVARDAAGSTLGGRAITWSSSNAQVATVSSSGVVNARAVGEARIAASAGGRSALSTITVTAREVASVAITPVAVSVRVGRSATLQARALDADAQPLPDRAITWSTGNAAVATVTSQGVVTAVAPGATTVTATSDGRTAQAAVTVTPEPVASVAVTPALDTLAVGGTRTLTAALRDVDGALLTGRSVVWSVSNVAVATVSSTGEVTALAPGTVQLSAVSEGRVGQATVVVLERFANAVTLTPNSGTLQVGAELTLQAQVTDPAGTLLPDRVVSFSTDAPLIATVSGTGLVTARAPGVARITALSEGKSAVAVITVVPVAVSQVLVTPAASEVLEGAARQLTAQARSASGAVLTGRDITWTSGAPGIASVTATGIVNGLTPGVAVLAATVDGVSGFATVTVRPRVVTTVQLAPLTPSIAANTTVQLGLTVRDQTGTALTGRPVTWRSSDDTIAFVSSTGLVVGLRAGAATITATVEGVSGSTLVTVR
jgi:trimeric autotransporter adhesin